MRIVVVEDEERSRVGLVNLIQSIDPAFKVVGQAENGKTGAVLVRDLLPDVVMTDIRMPEMDGLQMIALLKAEHRCPCRFVIVSAYSDFEYARQALRYDVSDYILKPVTYEEVEGILSRIARNLQPSPLSIVGIDELYPVPESASPIVRSAVSIIRKEYATQISLETISLRLNVSNEYMSQLFSKQMGIPLTAYIRHYRVEVAKRLLLEQKWSIQDVASMTGYSNAKYFHRVFREIAGVPPAEFAKQYRTGPEPGKS